MGVGKKLLERGNTKDPKNAFGDEGCVHYCDYGNGDMQIYYIKIYQVVQFKYVHTYVIKAVF